MSGGARTEWKNKIKKHMYEEIKWSVLENEVKKYGSAQLSKVVKNKEKRDVD